MANDSLGDRMKEQYEDRTRYFLPRRTYTILRVDGKAFHTFTRGCKRPFDDVLASAMYDTMEALMGECQGSCLGYTQSDEISILLQDFNNIKTEAWFNGNIQKIVSVAASVATVAFNHAYEDGGAEFDARVFTVPDPIEVENYFIWRQQDATRNSIQMVGQSRFSQRELNGKSCDEIQEMLFQVHKVNWNDLETRFKRGACYIDELVDLEIPVFTADRDYLRKRIPKLECSCDLCDRG